MGRLTGLMRRIHAREQLVDQAKDGANGKDGAPGVAGAPGAPGKDGVNRHSLANYIPDIVQGEVKGFLVQVTEVTQLKQVEADLRESRRQLRSMAASREEALEQERKHIARELHDELGQLLTGLKMDLSVLKLHCADQPPSLEVIADMNTVVERTFEVIRSVATSLRPSVLNIGLVPALEWLVYLYEEGELGLLHVTSVFTDLIAYVAVLHDAGYSLEIEDRALVDRRFFDILTQGEVPTRWLMYLAVRIGGWPSFPHPAEEVTEDRILFAEALDRYNRNLLPEA